MGHLMRLNRDVDDFRVELDEDGEGDITLRCTKEGCPGKRLYLFGYPTMGELIADAYEHLDDAHPED